MMATYPAICHVLCIASVIYTSSKCSVRSMKITYNQYDDVVIAIHPDVKEDRKIISQIKEMVMDASKYLYQATRNRAYLGTVNILVPDTWSKDEEWSQNKDTHTFEEADVRIDNPNPIYGNNPYTFQPRQCGEPGKYVHFTPSFMLDRNKNRAATWGNTGRVFVHEFAHLRYGVFDEYGTGSDEYPHLYVGSDGQMYPTACTHSITRGQYIENGVPVELCSTDPETDLANKNCTFLAHQQQNSATASLMYDHTLAKVNTFCEDNSLDPDQLHNAMAPTRHNKMCNGKATWDVILDHKDFKNANYPVTVLISAIEPTINVLYNTRQRLSNGAQICGRPVVLVLDVSGSMKIEKFRYFQQRQMADKLIRDVLPIGTSVGIVTFSTDAKVHAPMTSLGTAEDRDRLAKGLPGVKDYGGGTCIGKGLLKAREMLTEADHDKRSKAQMVLITDGAENGLPKVNQVKGTITESDITVHAVAYSQAAAQSIKDLSVDTGGQYAFYSESANSTALDSIIQTLMKDISICPDSETIEIFRKAVQLNPPVNAHGEVHVDSTVGRDTMFVFTCVIGSNIKVILKSPSDITYSSNSKEFSKDEHLNIIRYKYSNIQAGVWTYKLEFQGFDVEKLMDIRVKAGHRFMSPEIVKRFYKAQLTKLTEAQFSVAVVVKALRTTGSEPYKVDSWLSSPSVDIGKSEPAVVYVHVHKGYSPITAAAVTLNVERPKPANSVKFQAKDDGKSPDNAGGDGVYTAAFIAFKGNTRYSWDVDVKSVPETRLVLESYPAMSLARSHYQNTSMTIVMAPTEAFMRSTSPGAMDVTGYVANKDVYPPSVITDLRVHAVDRKRRTATVLWTAPGDDLTFGRASAYELRYTTMYTGRYVGLHIRTYWKTISRRVPVSYVTEGSLVPHSAGTTEHMTVRIPSDTGTAVIGLQTRDHSGKTSEVSNLVTISYKVPTFAFNTTSTRTTTHIPTTSARKTTTTTTRIPTTTTTTTTTTTMKSTTQIPTTTENVSIPVNIEKKGTRQTTPIPTTTTTIDLGTTAKYTLGFPTITPWKGTSESPDVVNETDAGMKRNVISNEEPDPPWMQQEVVDPQTQSNGNRQQLNNVEKKGRTNHVYLSQKKPSSNTIGVIIGGVLSVVLCVVVGSLVAAKLIIKRVHARPMGSSLA